ncbi:MAG TPA: cyclic nucleotide-binding domain-containing protein [Ktedonobacteraceae bacterium]|nr:cyclic nucleotide-binding domain-containing protein [Ktedonobacteraceae bacterium]
MYEDTLAHVELLSNLDKKELQVLSKSCQERKYSAGSTLIKQGDTGVGLYVIISGHVKTTQAKNPDRAEVDLGTYGPGNVLGEMALLDDLPRSATITAVDDVTALLLPVWEFRATVRDHPEIALKLLAVLSKRLRNIESKSDN